MTGETDNKIYGYVRVSTREQNEDRQMIALPDNFYDVHKAWREKDLTLKQAASTCNMPVGTFYSKARKFENAT